MCSPYFFKKIILFILVLLSYCAPTLAESVANNTEEKSIWTKVWGATPESPQVYIGMWSYHLTDINTISVPDYRTQPIKNNELIGLQYKGLVLGTLLNSYDQRTYLIAIQRTLFETSLNHNASHLNIGYRLGILYGYGENSKDIVKIKSPIIPFPELFIDLDWNHLGIEVVSTAAVLISVRGYIRF
jgi:hypothetical protein